RLRLVDWSCSASKRPMKAIPISRSEPEWRSDVTDCLRKVLLEQARAGSLMTYRQLAERLSLRPPGTIRRVAEALEILMTEDASAGRPLVAAFCVSRLGEGLPARGFFLKARDLGLFSGDPNGPEA